MLAISALGAETGYVDPAACRSCHAAVYDSYLATGMGRSLSKSVTPPAGEYYHRASNRYYRIYARDGRFFMRRHMLDPAGLEIQVFERSIDLAVGSGNHAVTYLSRTPDGRLLQLPLSWYAGQGGYWAMSPGYDRRDHPDFRREVSDSCLFCHNGYPSPANGGLAEGIDCQRCHGPGAAHLQAPARGTIVNPRRLPPERSLDVCLQCHLETESRGIPDSLLRLGRGVFSFRPGEPLTGYKLYFDRPPGPARAARFEVNHAGYRFLQSPCFVRSGGRLSCLTCHDPHQIPRGEAAVAHYRRVCLGCHGSAHSGQSDDCTSCHMPKRRTTDAVHVLMTDHLVRRLPPEEDALAPRTEDHRPYQGRLVPFHPESPGREDLYYLVVARVRSGHQLEAAVGDLENLLASGEVPSVPAAQRELASGYRRLGQLSKAARLYRRAAATQPTDPGGWIELGDTLLRLGRLEESRRALEKARRLSPRDYRVLNALAVAWGELGRLDRAVDLLGQSTRANPDQPLTWMNLGVALEKAGDGDGAEKAYCEALRLQPDLTEARHHLEQLRTHIGRTGGRKDRVQPELR